MSDLIGFDDFLNTTTPFDPKEHKVKYKTEKRYLDYSFGNIYNETCQYPRFWNESGGRVLKGCQDADDDCQAFDQLVGCYNRVNLSTIPQAWCQNANTLLVSSWSIRDMYELPC